jgi:hypothetical protein
VGDDTDKHVVRRVPMDQIVIYPVRDDELAELESGGPSSTIFSIMLTLVGISVGGFIALLLGPVPAPGQVTARFVVSVAITGICTVASLVLGGVWWRVPNRTKQIVAKIRARDKVPTGTPAQGQPSPAAHGKEKS